jgi:hypothetical protein
VIARLEDLHFFVIRDLFPMGGRRSLQPPWELRSDTLRAIDGHFWDWVLWLGSKALRHEAELVSGELAKMQWFLLGPTS